MISNTTQIVPSGDLVSSLGAAIPKEHTGLVIKDAPNAVEQITSSSFNYYISPHLSKAFESLFSFSTCLPTSNPSHPMIQPGTQLRPLRLGGPPCQLFDLPGGLPPASWSVDFVHLLQDLPPADAAGYHLAEAECHWLSKRVASHRVCPGPTWLLLVRPKFVAKTPILPRYLALPDVGHSLWRCDNPAVGVEEWRDEYDLRFLSVTSVGCPNGQPLNDLAPVLTLGVYLG